MPLEPKAEPQAGQPLESQPRNLVLGERRSLMDVWRVLTKRRFTILAVTIFSLSAAAWYAFRTPPVYETVSRIEIEPNQFASGDFTSLFAEDEGANSLQTQMRVLESDSVLFQTAQNLDLIRLVRGAKMARPIRRLLLPALLLRSAALWWESSGEG